MATASGSGSILDALLEINRSKAAPFVPQNKPRLCVVTCDDSALTGQLEARLGLVHGGAVLIRLPAGALSAELVQRAVAKAVYVEGCSEVVVLTHSACTLAALSTNEVIEALGRGNVSRAAVPFDMRELVGAGQAPREAALGLAEQLRRCAFLPESLLIHVANLDEATGQLGLLERGEPRSGPRFVQTAAIGGYQSGPAVVADGPDLSDPSSAPPAAVPPPLPTTTAEIRPARSTVARAPLSDDLRSALRTLAGFIGGRITPQECKRVRGELTAATSRGNPSEQLIKMALRPILQLGDVRYKVMDELTRVREGLADLPPEDAANALQQLYAEPSGKKRS